MTELLIKVLLDKDEDLRVRHYAEYTFRRRVDLKVVESLVKVLVDKSENNWLRVGSTEVLERISRHSESVELTSRLIDPLIKVINNKNDDPWVRGEAEWALERIVNRPRKHRLEQLFQLPDFRGGWDNYSDLKIVTKNLK